MHGLPWCTCVYCTELQLHVSSLPSLRGQRSHARRNALEHNGQEVDHGLATEVCAEGRRKEDGKPLRSEDESWLVQDKALKGGEHPREDKLVSVALERLGGPASSAPTPPTARRLLLDEDGSCVRGLSGLEQLTPIEVENEEQHKEDCDIGRPAKEDLAHRGPILPPDRVCKRRLEQPFIQALVGVDSVGVLR